MNVLSKRRLIVICVDEKQPRVRAARPVGPASQPQLAWAPLALALTLACEAIASAATSKAKARRLALTSRRVPAGIYKHVRTPDARTHPRSSQCLEPSTARRVCMYIHTYGALRSPGRGAALHAGYAKMRSRVGVGGREQAEAWDGASGCDRRGASFEIRSRASPPSRSRAPSSRGMPALHAHTQRTAASPPAAPTRPSC